jgi:lysylphosphatidylglycerol synthetase-like protein (DUF2156 family)
VAKSNRKTNAINLILGLIAIIFGILISIFKYSYFYYMLLGLGVFFVGVGSYILAKKQYTLGILLIIAGVLQVFLTAIGSLSEITYIILGAAIIIIISVLMLADTISKKEKGFKLTLAYGILIFGLLAGAVLISIAYFHKDWLYILFGISFAIAGLLTLVKSI